MAEWGRRLRGPVAKVSGAAPHAVVVNPIAHVAPHALLADQVVQSCGRRRDEP